MQCDIFIREVQSECQKMNSGHISILSSHDPGKSLNLVVYVSFLLHKRKLISSGFM